MEFFQINNGYNNKINYTIYLNKYYKDENIINKNSIKSNEKKIFKNLIYEKLEPGNYYIEISPADIKKTLYLKILANDIIISDEKRKEDLYNGGMGMKNCNCLFKNIPDKQCCFCLIYEAYQLIDIIVKSLIKLIIHYRRYIYNNDEVYNELLPINSEEKTYSYLYYHYMSTQSGFIVLIINKYHFNWECKSRIEYNKKSQEFYAFFEFGNFKITKTLIIYDYETSNLKNIFESFNYSDSSFNLLEIDNFIKNNSLITLEDINIIYLLDTTRSMDKNKQIVYSIKNINDSLKKIMKI